MRQDNNRPHALLRRAVAELHAEVDLSLWRNCVSVPRYFHVPGSVLRKAVAELRAEVPFSFSPKCASSAPLSAIIAEMRVFLKDVRGAPTLSRNAVYWTSDIQNRKSKLPNPRLKRSMLKPEIFEGRQHPREGIILHAYFRVKRPSNRKIKRTAEHFKNNTTEDTLTRECTQDW